MKRIFYWALGVFVLVSCSKTPEQKAEALVKENVKKVLLKPDTYDPIETEIDSVYSPYNDPDFYKEVTNFSKLLSELPDCEKALEDAKEKMFLYDLKYTNSYFTEKYHKAKIKYEEAIKKHIKLKEKIQNKYEEIAAKIRGNNAFSGYAICHSFRANNNDGETSINNYFIFVDKNIENVLFALSEYELNEYDETINQIKEKMEDGAQWFSDDDDE